MIIDFTFSVLVYNHSQYIIEHLESIKYQVEQYGKNKNVKLVISDDGSKDDSLIKINNWINQNKDLFIECIILGDGINRGVGFSFTSMWEHIGNEPFKLLAGDDVYSYENIFQEAEWLNDCDFVTGMPLLLIDGVLSKSNSLMFHMLATQHIYEKESFFSKLKNINVINTPSLIYRNCFIKDSDTFDFIRKFRVTEDFPMMAHLSSNYKDIKFKTVGKVYIYYRRTPGSIYLVDNEKYNIDKENVFKYLESLDESYLGKFILRNRLSCYKRGGLAGKLLNFSYYLYLVRVIFKSPVIMRELNDLKLNEGKHATHYALIKDRVMKFNEVWKS
ncbi:glycosyltransferase family 2 protein [Enterovibrio sp. ZSDZ42]|uniref:Glycosyltransferase family 2 protein n=1 Tax=Enterovibrio gelatinilyticus TaxID=2899819 RepID=A0ABT5QWH9_9GAMM|nr:glycosyltransferase family 2 protein [Enterovibrio sp. ZSDZ42]MDD1792383.1 glycosyltransferase family 2 protein [Enterovibrio sp. ZSDZ42]